MLKDKKNIFFVGIKGVAMTNLAVMFKKMGKNITGSDIPDTFITDELLHKNKIHVITDFSHLPSTADLVVYSASHGGRNNPKVHEAKKRGITVLHQVDLIRMLMDACQNKIAVCGSHGKTTISSLLAFVLLQLGEKPSYLTGTPFLNGYEGGQFQEKKYFVVEADEYGIDPPVDTKPKFHFLNPTHIIASNIDYDHPDIYKNIHETQSAFLTFFEKLSPSHHSKKLFSCADDNPLMKVCRKLPRDLYETYGFSPLSDLHITHYVPTEQRIQLFLTYKNKNRGLFETSLWGEKNVSNVAGVILALLNLGFSAEEIKKAVVNFKGARRRFEKIAHINDIYLFDDYAHHPAEIAATMQAARSRFPKRRIIIIFQPHTYSRTKALLTEFAQSLSLADITLILPIFSSARENYRDFNVTSDDIVEMTRRIISHQTAMQSFSTKDLLLKALSTTLRGGDVIFTMGAGDVYKLKDDIIKVTSSL